MLLQFPAYGLDAEKILELQADIEEIWQGDDGAITATSDGITSVAVTDEITGRQTESIVITIVVAFVMLMVFYWTTLRQPALAIVAVGADCAGLDLGAGHDGAGGHSLYVDHFDHHRALDRDWCGLHDPRDPPLSRGVLTVSQSGAGGNPHARDHGFGIAGLGLDDGARSGRAGVCADRCDATIRYYCGNHHRVCADRFYCVVPPAMTIWGAYQNMRLRSASERTWNELDVELDDAALQHQDEQAAL